MRFFFLLGVIFESSFVVWYCVLARLALDELKLGTKVKEKQAIIIGPGLLRCCPCAAACVSQQLRAF